MSPGWTPQSWRHFPRACLPPARSLEVGRWEPPLGLLHLLQRSPAKGLRSDVTRQPSLSIPGCPVALVSPGDERF